MANFDVAYQITLKHEGGYANDPNDKGGETYCGIARKYTDAKNYPKGSGGYLWPGWSWIDSYKKRNGRIKYGTRFKELDQVTRDFYYNYKWSIARGEYITNQDVANFVFDSVTLHGYGAMVINTGINLATGQSINIKSGAVINKITDATLSMLNSSPAQSYPYLIAARKNYVNNIPDNTKFINGWMNRINSFPASIINHGAVAPSKTPKKKQSLPLWLYLFYWPH
jgi:lysozyme family protein